MIPGSNILAQALTVIAKQPIMWSAYAGSTTTASGLKEDTYADPVEVLCSIQAVQRSKYESLGLDLQKSYVTVYASAEIGDMQRNRVGDLITYGGRRYRVLSSMDWMMQDGWQKLLCQDIGDD